MKTKILTSLALASLMSLYFVGCSSEKSAEELEKLSQEELTKMKEKCIAKKGARDEECMRISNVLFIKEQENKTYHSMFEDDNNKEDKK